MIGKILAGATVLVLMGLLLVGFTYNGAINQRGPLGIMGTVGTYVFPHAAGRGFSIQDSNKDVGPSAEFYVEPDGDVFGKSYNIKGGELIGSTANYYFAGQAITKAASEGECLIAESISTTNACGNGGSDDQAAQFVGQAIFNTIALQKISCIMSAVTTGGGDSGDQVVLKPIVKTGEGATSSEATCSLTIDLNIADDSAEFNGYGADCASESIGTSTPSYLMLQVDSYTDTGTAVSDLDLVCSITASEIL